jgi:hypothetical protein
MPAKLSGIRETAGKAGFYLLGITLFMISGQRMISLYSLGLFLLTGFVIWTTDFERTFEQFRSKWLIIVPPIFYFLLHVLSLVIQHGNISLLETRLMFFFIPLLGFPVFLHQFTMVRLQVLLKLFVAGLVLVSLFLIIRIVIVFFLNVPAELTFIEYFYLHNTQYVSWNFSILEHPSYLSVKLIFAFIVLFLNSDEWKIRGLIKWGIFLLFSVTIFLLASKAGILAWIVTSLAILIISFRKKSMHPALYIIVFFIITTLTIISVRKMERLSYFIVYTGRGLAQKDFDWKNLDQRTRNWYAALVLIKDKPLTGNGIVRTQQRMVEVYNKNGFTEEAQLTMNAHNQFFEAQMTFGIAGTLSLLWMLLTPLIFRRKLPLKMLAFPFIILFSFFILFESMLNRQWGIMFFLLFYFIILLGLSPDSID